MKVFTTRRVHLAIIFVIAFVLACLYYYWPWSILQGQVFESPIFSWLHDFALVEFRYKFIGSLLLPLIIYGMITLQLLGVLVAFVLSLVAIFPIFLQIHPSDGYIIANFFNFLVPTIILTFIVFEFRWRNRNRELLRQFALRVTEAQEQERKRLANELHDDTMQTLSIIVSRLDKIEPLSVYKSEVAYIRNLAEQTIEELRRMSLDLRPAALDRLGLVSALKQLINRVSQESGVEIYFTIEGEERKLESKIETNVFRVIQETFNNVRQHSHATEVLLVLKYNLKNIEITIQDNGLGFNIADTMARLKLENKSGLLGIKDRVRIMNGNITIDSKPGQGTIVYFSLPYVSIPESLFRTGVVLLI